FTNQTLRRLRDELLHGIWTTHIPNKIERLESAQWESESHGFCTGTEGWVEFEVSDDSGVIRLHWNNPFVGSNEYSHTAQPLDQVSYKDGVGDNATVTFEIRCVDAPPF